MKIPMSSTRQFFFGIAAVALAMALPVAAHADGPGRGLTANYETGFLKMIIDHHYSALRITELAAGTAVHRSVQISVTEGTAPTPGTAATRAKASLDQIKSIARRNNRMQREEILMAQDFLRRWYGVNYTPRLTDEGQRMIHLLEQAQPGAQFDHTFLEVFSRHHFGALTPAATCVVASDIRHEELHRYCRGIIEAQLNDIEDMRGLLAERFNIVDYQPTTGLRGVHTGNQQEPGH